MSSADVVLRCVTSGDDGVDELDRGVGLRNGSNFLRVCKIIRSLVVSLSRR
jgi:hypothetical protein